MTNGLISFLLGAGLGTWVYSKMMRSSGGNTKSAAIVAIIAGVAAFGLAYSLLGLIPD